MILFEIKEFGFFDGINNQLNCVPKNEYWLGTSNQKIFMDSNLFTWYKNVFISINLFKEGNDILSKYVSNKFNDGFMPEDYRMLSREFAFETVIDESGIEKGASLGHFLSLRLKEVEGMFFLLLYSIQGTRAPESIYFHGLYEVYVDEKFKSKYLS